MNINLAPENLGCYKTPMPRKVKEPKTDMLGVMVTSTIKKKVGRIADAEERSLSNVGGLLLLRGLAAFDRDGQLREPEELPEEMVVNSRAAYRAENQKKAQSGKKS